MPARSAIERALLLLSLVTTACATRPEVLVPSPHRWTSPLGRDHALAGRTWDIARRVFVSDEQLIGALASARFVGVGEQHDNADHHRLEARIVDVLASRGRAPGVVFEMLDRDDEPAVRRALALHPRDPDAVAEAVDWKHSGWPAWSLYRPVFASVVTKQLPLFGAGVDRKAAMRLVAERTAAVPVPIVRDYALDAEPPGAELEALREEMREAHCGLLPDSMLDGMVFIQRVRDAMLADGLARAGAERGGVLIAGNGHVRRDRGVPTLVRRKSGVRMLSVGILEVKSEWARPEDYAAAFDARELPFDYVVFTPRASDVDHCAEVRRRASR